MKEDIINSIVPEWQNEYIRYDWLKCIVERLR